MRNPTYVLALLIAISFICACDPARENSAANNASNTQPAKVSASVGSPGSETNPAAPTAELPVATGHGSTVPQAAAPSAPGPGGTVDTSAYDAKIKQAEARAKSSNATDSDKKAAAAAYLERANVYYTAGQPSLYKFALGDFRTALKYDPSNDEARTKMDQIVSIYQSMGRPVPSTGLDQ
ncbi:MAG: hypothetical protein QOH96_669 [Blastocatellia bacterium]|nr:hypothetical protein [Blastocatellia bacterium]